MPANKIATSSYVIFPWIFIVLVKKIKFIMHTFANKTISVMLAPHSKLLSEHVSDIPMISRYLINFKYIFLLNY